MIERCSSLKGSDRLLVIKNNQYFIVSGVIEENFDACYDVDEIEEVGNKCLLSLVQTDTNNFIVGFKTKQGENRVYFAQYEGKTKDCFLLRTVDGLYKQFLSHNIYMYYNIKNKILYEVKI